MKQRVFFSLLLAISLFSTAAFAAPAPEGRNGPPETATIVQLDAAITITATVIEVPAYAAFTVTTVNQSLVQEAPDSPPGVEQDYNAILTFSDYTLKPLTKGKRRYTEWQSDLNHGIYNTLDRPASVYRGYLSKPPLALLS